MDYLRTGRRQWARLYRDRPDILTRIRWYRASPTAKQLPIPHTYGFVIYDDPVRFEKPHPGFVGDIDHFTEGINHGQPGTHFHGDPDWFLHGAPFGAVNPDGPCIQYLGRFSGSFVFRGSYEMQEWRGAATMHGRFDDATESFFGAFELFGDTEDNPEAFSGSILIDGSYEEPPMPLSAVECLGSATVGASGGDNVRFDTVEYDTDDYIAGGDSTCAVVPHDGVYQIEGHIAINDAPFPSASNFLEVDLTLLPSTALDRAVVPIPGDTNTVLITGIVFAQPELAAGDSITLTASMGWFLGADSGTVNGALRINYLGPLP